MSNNALFTLALVNSETNRIVSGYEDLGSISTIDLGKLDLKQYNIIAQVNPNYPDAQLVKSIKFESPSAQQVESVKPYALFGDANVNFNSNTLNLGDFSLKVTAYTQGGATGQEVGTVNLNYSVVDNSSAPTTPLPTPTPTTPPTPDNAANIVDVNLNVLHTVGGESTFDRKKWMNVHSSRE